MIDGEKGELSVDDYDDLLDEHHVNIKRRTYRYEPIQGTEFRYILDHLQFYYCYYCCCRCYYYTGSFL